MAGVTNAPFRTLCREFAPGLVYVNEMVMATAVVHGNSKTERMMTFGADEQPRSLQIYGSDPVMLGEAIRKLCDADRVDHIDINFGCPAAKVTRKGGGAAVPAKPNLLRAILREAVAAARPFDVPVTIKFRKGLFDSLLTYIETGRIAVDEGVAAIALHARTAEQHYAGMADWDAIGELKAAVPEIPVLGNGDIWEAADAVAMMRADRLRRRRRRSWLPRPAVAVPRSGRGPQRSAGAAVAVAGRGLCGDGPPRRICSPTISARIWRCATSASTPRGTSPAIRSAARRADGSPTSRHSPSWRISSRALDPTIALVAGGERIRRGHTNGPIRVALPDGYLDHLDDVTVPDDSHVMALSGG